MADRKDFSVALISLFNVDFGARHLSSFLKSKGYPAWFIAFQQQRLPQSIIENDYFINPPLNHNLCPSEDLRLLINLLKELKPNLVGLSVASGSFATSKIITSQIKRDLNVPVVWGGVHAILCPEDCIPYADYVCLGEGEYPLWELSQKLHQGQPVTGIKNLWIKKENGEIEKNPLRPLITDLDSLPFPDLVEDGNKFLIDEGRIIKDPRIHSCGSVGVYPIMTSRGCMFTCSYCCNSIIRKKYDDLGPYLRRRSPKNVIDELSYAFENKPLAGVRFWDDVFTYDEAWVREFTELYKKKIGKTFSCYGHPRHSNQTIMKLLADAGLIEVHVGIQSGSERVSQGIMKRPQKNQDIIAFTEFVQKENINIRFDLIADNPCETEEDHEACIDLLLSLPRPYNVIIFSMCYFPKTPMTEQFLESGVIQERDLETHTSKSISNFNMFLPLSRSRKDLFWNCVMAMAVANYFPEKFIKSCKKNKFFKRNPEIFCALMSFAARLRFFLRYKVLLKKRYFSLIFPDGEPRFLPVESYTYLSRYKVMPIAFPFEILFFPKGQSDGQTYSLKVIKNENYFDAIKFCVVFEMHEFRHRTITPKIAWKLSLKSPLPKESSLELRLDYPNLIVVLEGKETVLEPLYNQIKELNEQALHIIKFKFVLSFNLLPLLVSHVLCYPRKSPKD